MDIEIIERMIRNSTWIDPQKQTVYKFSKENNLSINGRNHIQYSLKKRNNQVLIKLGTGRHYAVDYVCDFILNIHGDDEKFMITPA